MPRKKASEPVAEEAVASVAAEVSTEASETAAMEAAESEPMEEETMLQAEETDDMMKDAVLEYASVEEAPETEEPDTEAAEPNEEDASSSQRGRRGPSMRQAYREARTATRQDMNYIERVYGGEAPVETASERARRVTNDLFKSHESGVILTGTLAGSAYLRDKDAATRGNDPEYLESHVVAIVVYEGREILIPYSEFVHDGMQPPSSGRRNANGYQQQITGRQTRGLCPEVDFVVTRILQLDDRNDAANPNSVRYMGSRRKALRARALRDYAGIWEGRRHVALQPVIREGRSYPARIIAQTGNGIVGELSGYVFFLHNYELSYSRRLSIMQKLRQGVDGYIYVWVTSIQYDEQTQTLQCTFTGKNPHESDCDVFIREHDLIQATRNEDTRSEGQHMTKVSYRAEVTTLTETGLYAELIDHPGVQVRCAYSDHPIAASVKQGDHIRVRLSRYYAALQSGNVLLGRIDRVPPTSSKRNIYFT